jgi:hypothetical protein
MNKEEQSLAESGKASLKPQIANARPSWQCAGHTAETVEWFQIGLSSVEITALKMAQEEIIAGPTREGVRVVDFAFATDETAFTLRILFLEALAHLDVLLPCIHKDLSAMNEKWAMKDKNLHSASVFLDEVIKQRGLAKMAAEAARK